MPLFDKVKAQATQLAQKAQEAGKVGQAKIEEAQARRRADGLLRNLGAAYYAERTGKAGPDSTQQIDELVSQLSAYEAEHGPIGADASDDNGEDASAPNS